MMLSEHFALSEFMVSETAARQGLRWPDVSADVYDNLERLALSVGEPLREALGGQPIIITSGWRPENINRAIGGARRSAHISGRAMDIHVPGVSLETVAYECLGIAAADKVILEFNAWVHVQIAGPGREPRQQALCAYIEAGASCYATGFEPPGGSWL